jgi:hypothetical protein
VGSVSGTGDTIKHCRNVGLDEPGVALMDGFVITIRRKPEPAFKAVGGITGEVTGVATGEVQRLLTVAHPTSSKQKYRLTQKGQDLIAKQAKGAGADGK